VVCLKPYLEISLHDRIGAGLLELFLGCVAMAFRDGPSFQKVYAAIRKESLSCDPSFSARGGRTLDFEISVRQESVSPDAKPLWVAPLWIASAD
jgi:hypothetical protein